MVMIGTIMLQASISHQNHMISFSVKLTLFLTAIISYPHRKIKRSDVIVATEEYIKKGSAFALPFSLVTRILFEAESRLFKAIYAEIIRSVKCVFKSA